MSEDSWPITEILFIPLDPVASSGLRRLVPHATPRWVRSMGTSGPYNGVDLKNRSIFGGHDTICLYIFIYFIYIYIFMYWYRLIRDLYHRYWAIFDGDVTWHIPFIDWIRLVFLLQVPELSPDTYLTIVCWESWSYPEIGWYAQQCWCQGVAFWHIRLLEDSLTDAGCTCAHTFTWICWRW
jgi:hypothetical protein